MFTEKRKEDRSVFTRQPKGELQILARGQSLPVFAVKDASSSGIRLETDTQMDIGEKVLVRYLADGLDLSLNGVVIWNADAMDDNEEISHPHGYIVGIQLASPLLLQALW